MEGGTRSDDPWGVAFAAASVITVGLLLIGDRYVELLAAGAAYAATWVIVRHETRPDREEHVP